MTSKAAILLSSIAVLAFAGCESVPSPIAPPVTAAMAKSTGRQQVDLAWLNSGRSAFVSRCAECHALPAVNEHTRAQWPVIVAQMAKRSGLGPEQRENVLAYILAARGL